jgi:hypothetical protein
VKDAVPGDIFGTLHGEGQPNREVDSGEWIAYPREPDTECEVWQRAVVAVDVLSQVQTETSKPGQPLTLEPPPLHFTVELRGHCLWQKVV